MIRVGENFDMGISSDDICYAIRSGLSKIIEGYLKDAKTTIANGHNVNIRKGESIVDTLTTESDVEEYFEKMKSICKSNA